MATGQYYNFQQQYYNAAYYGGYGYYSPEYYQNYNKSVEDTVTKYRGAQQPYQFEHNKDCEQDPHRLQQRQKQVEFGKNTVGYKLYIKTVAKQDRISGDFNHPQTPNIQDKCSKRAFDGRVRQWRRLLHKWDPEGVELDDDFKNEGEGNDSQARQKQADGGQEKDGSIQFEQSQSMEPLSQIKEEPVEGQDVTPSAEQPVQVNLQFGMQNEDGDIQINLDYRSQKEHTKEENDMDIDKGFQELDIASQPEPRSSPVSQKQKNSSHSQNRQTISNKGVKKIKLNPHSRIFEPKYTTSLQETDNNNPDQVYDLLFSSNTYKQKVKDAIKVSKDNKISDSVNRLTKDKSRSQKPSKVSGSDSIQQDEDPQKENWIQNKQQDQRSIVEESNQVVREIEQKQKKNRYNSLEYSMYQQQYNGLYSSSFQDSYNAALIYGQQGRSINSNRVNSAWFQRPLRSLYKDKSRNQQYNPKAQDSKDYSRVQKQRRSSSQLQSSQKNGQTTQPRVVVPQKISNKIQPQKVEKSQIGDSLQNAQTDISKEQNLSQENEQNVQKSSQDNSDKPPTFKRALMQKKANQAPQEVPKAQTVVPKKVDVTSQKIPQPESNPQEQQNEPLEVQPTQVESKVKLEEVQEGTPISPPPGYEQTDFDYYSRNNLIDSFQQASENSLGGTSKAAKASGDSSQMESEDQSKQVSAQTSFMDTLKSDQEQTDDMDTPPGFEVKSMLPQNFEFVVK